VIYVALEPLVRRRWPERIVSWTRLLAGRLQDPMVGRDLLIGVGVGTAMVFAVEALIVIPARLGWPTVMSPSDYGLLSGPAAWVAGAMSVFDGVVTQSLVMMSVLSLMRLVLRRTWMASAAFFSLSFTIGTLANWPTHGPLAIVAGALIGALVTGIAVRYGLLAMAAAFFSFFLLLTFPVAAWPGAWYAPPGLFAFLLLAVFVALGVRGALAGRSILEMRALQE
jgi:hypothetical protein